jgi:hypothetical protein
VLYRSRQIDASELTRGRRPCGVSKPMVELLLPNLIVCGVGLVAGVMGGVIGFGTTILLMPPLVHF